MTFSPTTTAALVLLTLFVLIGGVLVLRVSSVEVVPQGNVITLTGPGGEQVILAAEIADDPQERQTGLMFRTELPAGNGMLFVFDTERPLSFWMKNTLIPLDILFFDQVGRFVSRATMEPCEVEVCPATPSQGAAKYALEVNRNEAKTAAVGEGWRLSMDN